MNRQKLRRCLNLLKFTLLEAWSCQNKTVTYVIAGYLSQTHEQWSPRGVVLIFRWSQCNIIEHNQSARNPVYIKHEKKLCSLWIGPRLRDIINQKVVLLLISPSVWNTFTASKSMLLYTNNTLILFPLRAVLIQGTKIISLFLLSFSLSYASPFMLKKKKA